ncbi:MAG: tRNA 2-thiocytidine biosynthesis TtcA family protein [Clostridia bacterium]|nr:tRNA 2-thiocytidine biosynthesis TtcA family protein [Clostridia bacterium]
MSANCLPKPYHSKLLRGILEFDLISPGDKVLIGLSGGKDSMFLMYALNVIQSYLEIPFTIAAATVDLGFKHPLDVDAIRRYSASLGVEHYLITTRIADIIEERSSRQNPCAVCSYFRRAALNRFASEHGFEVVALAHHKDDAMETFLMNIIYAGKVSTLPWKTHLARTGVTVIRPMMYLTEKDVIKGVRLAQIEPVPSPCPYSANTSRARAKKLILDLSKENRMVRANIAAAMRNGEDVELWPAEKRHYEGQLD